MSHCQEEIAQAIERNDREWRARLHDVLDAQRAVLMARADEWQARAEGLRKYTMHHEVCRLRDGYASCDCGLDAALAPPASAPETADGG